MYKKREKIEVCRSFSNSFFPEKQGQVTIFIILGLILIFVVALIFLTKQEVVKIKPEELIPSEKGKIENFVRACIKSVGEEALFQLGLQGGYIEMPSEISNDASRHVRLSPFLVVPYWAYGEVKDMPSREEIKQRLDAYMEEHLRGCLFDLNAFKETYNLIEKTEITANTEILDNKVIFYVHWGLEVRDKNGEKISEVINHQGESPIQLGKVYETAKAVVERELLTLKLEDITQDLIALEHPNVPLTGLEMSCKRKTWDVSTVKKTLKDMLRVNIKKLRVKGTEFVEFPEELPYYQNHYVWNMGEGFAQQDISVVFNFENTYPFTFQVTPLTGTKMASNQQGGTDLISFLCLQTWKCTYDVMYPVVVRVKDEKTGYNFNMAFTVHLVRNIPNRKVAIEARNPTSINFPTDEEYCRDVRIPMTVVTNSQVVSDEAGVNDITPLEDVEISFSCLKYSCEMGQTDFDFEESGYQADLTVNYPYCVGGIVRGVKEGYKETWQRVVTEHDKMVELNLVPLHTLPLKALKVVKHDLEDLQEENLQTEELDENEVALVRLKRFVNGTLNHEIQQVISAKLSLETVDRLKVEFLAEADYQYEVEINVFDEENLIGGYKANWTIPWDTLQEAEEITFHTLTLKNPPQEDLFQLLLNLGPESGKVPLPEIK